jgi:hypothetical protein
MKHILAPSVSPQESICAEMEHISGHKKRVLGMILSHLYCISYRVLKKKIDSEKKTPLIYAVN